LGLKRAFPGSASEKPWVRDETAVTRRRKGSPLRVPRRARFAPAACGDCFVSDHLVGSPPFRLIGIAVHSRWNQWAVTADLVEPAEDRHGAERRYSVEYDERYAWGCDDRPGLQPPQMPFFSGDPGRWPGLVWRRTFGAGFRCNLELNAAGKTYHRGLKA
jgi:hypothetical protein